MAYVRHYRGMRGLGVECGVEAGVDVTTWPPTTYSKYTGDCAPGTNESAPPVGPPPVPSAAPPPVPSSGGSFVIERAPSIPTKLPSGMFTAPITAITPQALNLTAVAPTLLSKNVVFSQKPQQMVARGAEAPTADLTVVPVDNKKWYIIGGLALLALIVAAVVIKKRRAAKAVSNRRRARRNASLKTRSRRRAWKARKSARMGGVYLQDMPPKKRRAKGKALDRSWYRYLQHRQLVSR